MREIMWIETLFFISFIICFLDISNINIKYRNLIALFLMFFIVVFAIENEKYSVDYENYVEMFNESSFNIPFSLNSSKDFGFVWISAFFKMCFLEYDHLFMVFLIFSLFCYFYLFLYFGCGVFCGWYIFLTRNFIVHYIVQIRHGMAVALVLYSLKFIVEKKKFKYFLFCSLASLIHQSAVFGIFIYPVSQINWSVKKVFSFCIVSIGAFHFKIGSSIISYLYMIDISTIRTGNYIGTEYQSDFSILTLMTHIIFTILIRCILSKKMDFIYNIFISMMLLGIFTISIFSDFYLIAGRVSSLYFSAYIFLISKMLYDFTKNKISLVRNFIGILVLGFFWFIKNNAEFFL